MNAGFSTDECHGIISLSPLSPCHNAGSIMVSVRGIIVPFSSKSNTIVDVSVVALSSNDTNGRLLS